MIDFSKLVLNLLVVVKLVETLCYNKRILVCKTLSKLSVLMLFFNQIICYNLIVLFTEVPVKNHLKKHITLWKFVNTLYYILHYYRLVCSMYIVFVTKCNKILLSSFVKYCCIIKKTLLYIPTVVYYRKTVNDKSVKKYILQYFQSKNLWENPL